MSNSFIPATNILQGSQKLKRMKEKAANRIARHASVSSIGESSQKNRDEFRVTDRISSIYSGKIMQQAD